MPAGEDCTHWVEVVDGRGLLPVKMLGPYASEGLADRAQRGVMRLLNVARYSAAVVSQQALESRQAGLVCTPSPPAAALRRQVCQSCPDASE